MVGEAFVFSKGDELWKAKRQACAHAFYKERLVHMLEVMKGKLDDICDKWMSEIA